MLETDGVTCLEYLKRSHNTVYEYSKIEKLTDVTFACPTGNINAHLSVCALSEYLQKVISEVNHKSLPILVSVDKPLEELKLLLDFLYTGKFDQTISLQQYILMGINYAVSCLSNACFRNLCSTIKLSEEYNKLNNPYNDQLTLIFTCLMDASIKSKSRDLMINFFSFKPLLFLDYLKLIPIGEFFMLLSKGHFVMQDADNLVYFGSQYTTKCLELIKHYCLSNECDSTIEHKFIDTLTNNIKEYRKNSIPSIVIAPSQKTIDLSRLFGNHSTYEYNYKKMGKEISTFKDFPPSDWKICALTAYISTSWDGIMPFAGFDVTYENLWNGKKKKFVWKHRQPSSSYNVETLTIPPGDVLDSIVIRHGWVIDQITLITREGQQFGPFGNSNGGNLSTISTNRLNGPDNWTELNYSSDSDNFHTSEAYVQLRPSSKETKLSHMIATSIHGFKFVNIKTQDKVVWNQLKICLSGIKEDCLTSKFPYVSRSTLMKKHFSF